MRTRWITKQFSVLGAALLASARLGGQATELLDARNLGDRGMVFESEFIQKSGTMKSAVGVGDTNGDGFADVALAVREKSAGDPSVVLLVRGRGGLAGRHTVPGSLPETVLFRAAGIPSAYFEVPGSVGDLDGDGLSDLFISLLDLAVEVDYHYDGTSFLVHGSTTLTGEHDIAEVGRGLRGVVFSSSTQDISAWCSVASPGDFNGDGRSDLALGASASTNFKGEVNAGVVFILFDPGRLPAFLDLTEVGKSVPGIQIHGSPRPVEPMLADHLGATVGNLGRKLEAAGDFDGDGLGDLLIDEQETRPWNIHLFRGRPSLPAVVDMAEAAALENLSSLRGSPDGYLRGGFAGPGDLDGDGRSEVLLGMPRHSYRPMVTGNSAVHIVGGGSDVPPELDLSTGPDLELARTSIHALGDVDLFGIMVSPAGDLNADGIADFVTAATWAAPHGKRNAGEAYAVFGKQDFGRDVFLAEGYDGIRVLGENTGNALGNEASPAGDFNGDGAADLLLLAPQLGLAEDRSRAYLIYGTGSGPIPLRFYRAEPASGPLRGGSVVKLFGSGFTGVAGEPRVLFDGSPSSSARVISGSEIRAVTPPGGSAGPVDVTLEIGVEVRRMQDGFEYTPDFPEIDLASPGSAGFVVEGELTGEGTASAGPSTALGDITGDGAAELAIGSQTPRGWRVTVVRGGPGLPARAPAFTPSDRVSLIAPLEAAGDSAAHVAMLGDVNGDGVGDLGIGLSAGLAYVLFGRSSFPGEVGIEDERFERRAVRLEASGDLSDVKLVRLGDSTGDGIDDFATVLASASGFALNAGEVIGIAGRKAWPEDFDLDSPALVFARIRGTKADERLGEEIAPAGDVNGDGSLDLLAAARGGGGSGRAYLLHGGAGLSGEQDADSLVLAGGGTAIEIEDGFEHFNWLHVSAAGDTDADGFDDVLLGVEDGGESNQGVAYLVRGGPDLPGRLTLVEAPAAPGGVSRFFGAGPMVQCGRIAPAGDFNADGFDDFILGQLPEKPLAAYPWKVFVILGGRDLPDAVDLSRAGRFGLEIPGPRAAQVFLTCREAGDLNGDGQPDFALTGGFGPFDGTPGSVYIVFGPFGGTTFRRGDANFDGRIEISDAIYALSYLFLGGEAPRCEDAVDADDDGRLVLTDAVYILNHLFTGGPEPPPPYPGEGKDPTGDELECLGF